MDQGFELREKVGQLQQMLLDKHPKMPTLLREIHTALRQQPENVTLLSEQDIAAIVNGLKVQTGVEFATAAVKGTSSNAKSLASKLKSGGNVADLF